MILIDKFAGPGWLPLIGVMPLMKKLHNICGFYHLVWHFLTKKYGSIVGLRIGRDRLIIVAGKEAIKSFYSLAEFNGRPDGFFYRIRSFNKRLGIVFCDGQYWDVQRKFSVKVLRQLGMGRSNMIEHIEQEAGEMVAHLKELAKMKKSIDMHRIFDVPVLNIIWALLAGHRYLMDSCKVLFLNKNL